MAHYYNEFDPYAAAWLRNLIAAGHLPPGDVDERSIVDVRPDDLKGYTQCHFFAGIGGWSLAARLAGWPDDRELWTGSPPCQDHSVAGSVWNVRAGIDGERGQLARPWLALVGARAPSVVAFENVPGIEGRALAEIESSLASFGYRVAKSKRAASDLDAPHLRRRVWLIADRHGAGCEEPRQTRSQPPKCDPWRTAPGDVWVAAPDRSVGMADGFPARMAAIRAFGNAIVPQVAAEVIAAYMEA